MPKPCSTSNTLCFQEHRTKHQVQAGAPVAPTFSLKLASFLNVPLHKIKSATVNDNMFASSVDLLPFLVSR